MIRMENLTFSEFAKYADIPRTTVYTRLNNIKKRDGDTYDYFVFQENQTLKIYADRVDELKQFMTTDDYDQFMQQLKETKVASPSDEGQNTQPLMQVIQQLSDELKHSEERYNRLFDDYLRLSANLQEVNERLMHLTESQQAVIEEQARPMTWEEENQENIHHLASVIQNMDEQQPEHLIDIESAMPTDSSERMMDQRTRSEIRVESENDDHKGLLGRFFK